MTVDFPPPPFSRKVVVLQKKDEEAFGFEIQVRRALFHRPGPVCCISARKQAKHERFYSENLSIQTSAGGAERWRISAANSYGWIP